MQEFGGVEIGALPADGPVQVRAGYATSSAAQAKLLAAHDMLTLADSNLAEVHGEREKPHSVIDEDTVSCIVERPGQYHDTTIAGAYGRSGGGAKIEPFVITGESAVEDAARTEGF